jgi:hypothetical protein
MIPEDTILVTIELPITRELQPKSIHLTICFELENDDPPPGAPVHSLPDDDLRKVLILSDGRQRAITVAGLKPAILISEYWDAVDRFLATNDRSHLVLFEDEAVYDISGLPHIFETRSNVLHRLAFEF